MTKSRQVAQFRAANKTRRPAPQATAVLVEAFASKKKRRRLNPETGLTSAVLQLLALHREVAWSERINSGATLIGTRFIRFGFTGCADVIGQMKRQGAFLAIETKSKGKYPTKEQRAFLEKVAQAGGCSGVARSVDDAQRIILDWVRDLGSGPFPPGVP